MIGQQVISSLKWLGSARLLGQLVTTIVTLVVIRLLEPSDYGLLAMASVFLGLIMLLNEMGLGAALVQQKDVSRQEMEQVFGLLISVNMLLFALIYLIAPTVAWFFREPRVTDVVRVLALGLVLTSFFVVQRASLQRQMRFRARAAIDFSGMVAASLTTLTLAFLDFGVWSLVYGSLTGSTVQLIGTYAASRLLLWPKLSLRGMRHQVTFGGYLTVDRILWYLYTQSDAVVVGRAIGDQALGFYHVAKKLASLPLDKLGGTINEVGFAAYSRIQDDRIALQSHYCKVVRVAAFVGFPVCFGISATAPDAVPLILGEKWQDSVLSMQLIALVIPLRQLNVANTPALLGIGRPDVNVQNLVFALVIMPTAFVIGSQWGIKGVAIAWVVGYPVYFVIMLIRSLPLLGVSGLRYFQSLWAQALAAIIMYVVVNASSSQLNSLNVPAMLVLCTIVVIGMTTYLLTVRMIDRALLPEMLSLLRKRN